MSRKTGRPKKWTKEAIIAEIRRFSVDGIAPSTLKAKSLADIARYQFGSWENACKLAGVKTRGKPHGPRARNRTKYKKNEKTRMLAMALHIASMNGTTDLDSINNCINAVRYGLADEYYYQ
jgi:hypothetical protein